MKIMTKVKIDPSVSVSQRSINLSVRQSQTLDKRKLFPWIMETVVGLCEPLSVETH
ncbi:hypothetical protein EV672_1103 [Aquabacterium commune]|uniref:Uncharacterized protein n=1 Tax=Aquabacterium commune TaxID=70586 RepID=A0A4V3CV28_9BURK|nr:hypothetical protein EV672_1103 [Aquabacterium commune]